jgi:hypothetical protein
MCDDVKKKLSNSGWDGHKVDKLYQAGVGFTKSIHKSFCSGFMSFKHEAIKTKQKFFMKNLHLDWVLSKILH